MPGLFISLEGTEGCGKSTQVRLLTERLSRLGHKFRSLREPGGTPIGEEIRHTLKHSAQNADMTAEAELLLMNASRAQLVREVIRPALQAGETVVCDRFHDSTLAYQGYGRQLDLKRVREIVDFAMGDTRPDLTLLLTIPLEVSEQRRRSRQSSASAPRDRMEEAGRAFFQRVEQGYLALAAGEPHRVRCIDATAPIENVHDAIWTAVEQALKGRDRGP
jgi:dTMP kinase